MPSFIEIAYKEEVTYQYKYININAIAEIDVNEGTISLFNGRSYVISEDSMSRILKEVSVKERQ
jgi:uncharacterized protein YlzI (FlbEa/FlbD family)